MGDVTVRDFDGNTLSRFWQYGLMDWDLLYNCLNEVILSSDHWAIFQYDEREVGKKGLLCPANRNERPAPGTYMLLSPDGSPLSVGLVAVAARTRHPSISNTRTRADAYWKRVSARDPCCLITGLVSVGDFCRFKPTHIFPRPHEVEWVKKGYPTLITDPASPEEVGGPTKIDSIQNVILLRSDLHDAWDSYQIAVNPDRNYTVFSFLPGYEDVAGKVLKLDHIRDLNLRPLDNLFRDHFLQCVLKNMKGAGAPPWDHEGALGGGSMDLSKTDVWCGELGKAHLEFEMSHRLHGFRVAQEDD